MTTDPATPNPVVPNRATAGHDPGLYARSFADVYDAWYGQLDDPAELVAAVNARCNPGAILLELGGGTGRLASPLQQAGFDVISLDASTAMLAEAPSEIMLVGGDMSAIGLRDNSVEAAIIAYNTLFNLTSRDLQQRCLAEAARVLRPQGLLAVEAFIAPSSPSTSTSGAGSDTGSDDVFGMTIKAHPTDPSASLAILTAPDEDDPDVIVGSHIELRARVTTCRPWRLVYQSPDNLDRCAERAGLTLVERCSSWSGGPLDPDDDRHVSWYQAR